MSERQSSEAALMTTTELAERFRLDRSLVEQHIRHLAGFDLTDELQLVCPRCGSRAAIYSNATPSCLRCEVADLDEYVKNYAAEFVYLVWGIGTSLFKIGLTNSLSNRLRALRNQSPAPLELYSYIRVPSGRSRSIELSLHRLFRRRRLHGEWFEFPEALLPKVQRVFAVMGQRESWEQAAREAWDQMHSRRHRARAAAKDRARLAGLQLGEFEWRSVARYLSRRSKQ